jgi:predicted Zn-dependent protease with MMP-like domain
VDQRLRDFFDRELEAVLYALPRRVVELLDEVPLHVEDYPSDEVLRSTGVECREQLCGLYTGVPLTHRSMELSGNLPDVVTIYREGVLRLAEDAQGQLNQRELRRQIRITLLHELAHHHGIDEDELRELGYG